MAATAKSTRKLKRRYEPTDESRKMVSMLTAIGITQSEICGILNITLPTLHKYFRAELDTGLPSANARVAQSLFNMATKGGNVAAAIFWMKTRGRWSEARPAADEDKDAGNTITIIGGLPE